MNNPNLSPITRWAIILFSIEWIIWMNNFSAFFNVGMNNPNLSPRAIYECLCEQEPWTQFNQQWIYQRADFDRCLSMPTKQSTRTVSSKKSILPSQWESVIFAQRSENLTWITCSNDVTISQQRFLPILPYCLGSHSAFSGWNLVKYF